MTAKSILLEPYFLKWSFDLNSSTSKLWPFVSDTNELFRNVGFYPVSKTPLSRSTPDVFTEVATTTFSSYLVWQEEPFIWEKPFRFGNTRHYKLGIFKKIKYLFDLIPSEKGTKVEVKIWVYPLSNTFSYPVKLYLEHIVKRRLHQYLNTIDEATARNLYPYELSKPKSLARGDRKKVTALKAELVQKTRRQRIVNRLFNYLELATDSELEKIHPYKLAEYWGEKKYSVLNVFLNAAKIDILDFSWDFCCPNCKKPSNSFRKLRESRSLIHCESCDIPYEIDFNENTHLVFKPHPLMRKLSSKKFCLNGPQENPHKATQHYLKMGEDKYLRTKLEEGTYLFKAFGKEGFLRIHVRENGEDNINFILTDEDFKGQEATISTKPNLAILNRSSEKVLCFLEKENWKQEAIYATEVSSSHDFRTLFAKETLKDGEKVKASNVTMLFTDLMNSTNMFSELGDEFAIGQLMSHFKIMQQIIAEERGGVVKTIGDSVMAVFREPVSAIRSVERIQQIFANSTSLGEAFKLKAGIHFGDCTAVNLNDRIDYFGTTINIAARLVDSAKEKEIVVSEAYYNHPDVKLYLEKNRSSLFIKDSTKDLKGFDNEEFKVKEIRMERTPLRLVI